MRSWLRAAPQDLIVLVDFGAFNLRFAKTLRALGYRRPIVYFFPPGAWLDRERQARDVARHTVPLVPFEHQRDFYRSLGLGAAYFGHPLVSLIEPRGAAAAGAPRRRSHRACCPAAAAERSNAICRAFSRQRSVCANAVPGRVSS